eukprot:TRINITY_DN650_c0_g1_i1.p1 TRINITY_DN650_c0_g1~~TRINITY_DN650_c0_g1_i1.p1  ORF type:complete len:107 (-),score=23.78 TRINITY_DN650_c0_g1_i1:104-424(-)
MGHGGSKLLKDVMEEPSDNDKVKKLFATYDKDDNGTLDEKEFKKFAHDLLGFVADYKHRDKDDILDGRTVDQLAHDNFPRVDTNRDGKITFDEFREFVTGRSEWLK